MRKYRIKIEIEKSGLRWYFPQESSKSIFGVFIKWKCINQHGYLSRESFLNINSAESAIKTRIQYVKNKDNKKIVQIQYKNL